MTDVHEIPLPPGVGVEPTGPDTAQLVGDPDDLHALALSIKARLGGPHPLPVLLDSSLVVQAEREAREWKRRFDDLLAAVTSGQLTTVAALAETTAPPTGPEQAVSPFEAGTGPCTMKGCTETGAHVHPGWMVAQAAGKLTPALAASWSAQQWITFLRGHDLSQSDALTELRRWARDHGQVPPIALAAIKGRPDLARVLLDYAERAAAAIAQAAEPW